MKSESTFNVGKRDGNRKGGVLVVVLAAALLNCCATRQFESLQPGLEERGHHITGVSFYRQGDTSCGPAALASVASYWGRRVNLDQIAADVYLPPLRGTLPMDMERYMRQTGFETNSFSGSLDDIKARVVRDVPVICLIDLGFSAYYQPHYVTVIGFDDADEMIVMHDGLTPNRVIGYDTFLKEWARAGNWMLVVIPRKKEN